MKPTSGPEEMAETVLNLSKESSLLSSIWCKSDSNLINYNSSNGGSSNVNSCSPTLNERGGGSGCHLSSQSTNNYSSPKMLFGSNSPPRHTTIPLTRLGGGSAPTRAFPGIGELGGLGGTGGSSEGSDGGSSPTTRNLDPLLPFSQAWGNTNGGLYSRSISPVANQTVPISGGGVGLSLSFEGSPTLFPHHHIAPVPVSLALPFHSDISLPLAINTAGPKGRTIRPFKAYPKDPLAFPSVGLYGLPLGSVSGTTTEAVIKQQSDQAYAEFRNNLLTSPSQSQFGKLRKGGHNRNNSSPYHSLESLDDHHRSNSSVDSGGSLSLLRSSADSGSVSDEGCSIIMNGKGRLGKADQQFKDEAYWERRRKNNEAAKRSRDARRAKEDEIAIRAAFLEQENLKLRFEVCALKNETAKFRYMLHNS